MCISRMKDSSNYGFLSLHPIKSLACWCIISNIYFVTKLNMDDKEFLTWKFWVDVWALHVTKAEMRCIPLSSKWEYPCCYNTIYLVIVLCLFGLSFYTKDLYLVRALKLVLLEKVAFWADFMKSGGFHGFHLWISWNLANFTDFMKSHVKSTWKV